MLLYSFDERVDRVSLVDNSKSTMYLVVSLDSGKNYLFSSITEISSDSITECKLTARADVSFL